MEHRDEIRLRGHQTFVIVRHKAAIGFTYPPLRTPFSEFTEGLGAGQPLIKMN